MQCIDDDLLSSGYEPLKVIGKGTQPPNIFYKRNSKPLLGSIGRAVLCRKLSNGTRVVVKQVFLLKLQLISELMRFVFQVNVCDLDAAAHAHAMQEVGALPLCN